MVVVVRRPVYITFAWRYTIKTPSSPGNSNRPVCLLARWLESFAMFLQMTHSDVGRVVYVDCCFEHVDFYVHSLIVVIVSYRGIRSLRLLFEWVSERSLLH